MDDTIRRIENRSDIVRDTKTNAVLYMNTPDSVSRNKIRTMEKEIHTLKEDLQSIKNLLERLVDGR